MRGYLGYPAEAGTQRGGGRGQTVPVSWPPPATFLLSCLFFPPFLIHSHSDNIIYCKGCFPMIFTYVVLYKRIDACAPNMWQVCVCIPHLSESLEMYYFYVLWYTLSLLHYNLYFIQKLTVSNPLTGNVFACFLSEGSTWTSGPARPTRPLRHPRVRRNRCEYPLRFTSCILCYKDNHCTCNIALFCSTRVLSVEGAANENTPAQKELCFQQREGSFRRVPMLSPQLVSQ